MAARPTTALLVMTDGRRDCIVRTIPSMIELGAFSELWIHDDSGDPEQWRWLARTFPLFELIAPPRRLGFGGAIRNAWATLRSCSTASHVFHLEDDFVLSAPVHLGELHDVLEAAPHVVQCALLRQPWNAAEVAAGGIIGQHPDDYVQCSGVVAEDRRPEWVEHRRFFTTNPSLYRRELLDVGWPTGPESEGVFSARVFTDPAARSAFLGKITDRPRVEHIGHHRVGSGY